MANQKNSHKTFYILGLCIVLLIIGAIFFLDQQKKNTPSQQITNPNVTPETALLADIAVWYPSAPWTAPKKVKEETPYGNLSGESMQATVTSPTASIPHFEIASQLKTKGFVPDPGLSADGPGSSMWGYKRDESIFHQIIIFSYKTEPTSSNPNEPLQFNCPCKVTINVFVSSRIPIASAN